MRRFLTSIPLICLMLASLIPFGVSVNGEEEYPALNVEVCRGGPAPQVEGKIVHLSVFDNEKILVFTQFPQQIACFSSMKKQHETLINAPVSLPMVVLPKERAYVCAVESEEEGFFNLIKYSLDTGKMISER